MNEPYDRRRVPLVIALVVAAVTIKVLIHGNYCLVPRASLETGETGSAETSVYGITLYRVAGTDHQAMYDAAIGWYQAALSVEWAIAVAAGVVVYLLLWKWQGDGRTSFDPGRS